MIKKVFNLKLQYHLLNFKVIFTVYLTTEMCENNLFGMMVTQSIATSLQLYTV